MDVASLSGFALALTGAVDASGLASALRHISSASAQWVGATCGAMIYLTRSRESSAWRKVVHCIVSLVGGDALASWSLSIWPSLDAWFSAFIASAELMPLATLILNWVERQAEPALDRSVAWFVKRLSR